MTPWVSNDTFSFDIYNHYTFNHYNAYEDDDYEFDCYKLPAKKSTGLDYNSSKTNGSIYIGLYKSCSLASTSFWENKYCR